MGGRERPAPVGRGVLRVSCRRPRAACYVFLRAAAARAAQVPPYAEVVTMSERGEPKLTPAFERAIAAAKKAVEDAAAARAAHAVALAQRGQQQHVGRRNRPRGGGGN